MNFTYVSKILAFLFLAGWLGAGCGLSHQMRPRVLLIGIEGLSWDLLEAMIKTDEAPNFSKLRTQGAWGALEGELQNPTGIWVSIATGRDKAAHGVVSSITFDRASNQLVVPGRNAAALWEITARQNIPSGVIGWPGSAPIPKELTVRIDELAYYRGLGLSMPFPGQSIDVPPLDKNRLPFVNQDFKGDEVSIRIGAAALAEVPALAEKTWSKVRLLAVFLDSANGARHFAGAARMQGQTRDMPPYGKLSRKYIQQVDAVLGRLLSMADRQTMVLVATDDPTYRAVKTADGDIAHQVHGLAAVRGSEIVNGKILDNPSILDFAPMALTYLRIPLPEQMKDRPFSEAWSTAPPAMPKVATYDVFVRQPHAFAPSKVKPSTMNRLAGIKPLAEPGREPFNDRNVYALDLLYDGNFQGALLEAGVDLQTNARSAVSHYIIGEIHINQNQYLDGLESFDRANKALSDNPASASERALRVAVGLAFAEAYLSMKQPLSAVAQLSRVLNSCTECSPAVELLAHAYLALGETGKAESVLEQAWRRTPNNRRLLLALGQARYANRNYRGAREAGQDLLKTGGPETVPVHRLLGSVALHEEQWSEAATQLKAVTQAKPEDDAAWFDLASAYARAGRKKAAEEALLAGLRINPNYLPGWLYKHRISRTQRKPEQAARELSGARASIAVQWMGQKADD